MHPIQRDLNVIPLCSPSLHWLFQFFSITMFINRLTLIETGFFKETKVNRVEQP